MKTELILVGTSAIAAVFSVFMAWRSNLIARQALKLARVNQAKQEAPLSLYLVNGFRYRIRKKGVNRRLLGFSLSLTNTSTQPNSAVRIELHVDCVTSEGWKITYVLPHDSSLAKQFIHADMTPFECPALLSPKESRSRWALFDESDVIPATARRDQHRIVVADVAQKTATVTSLIISELYDGDTKNDEVPPR